LCYLLAPNLRALNETPAISVLICFLDAEQRLEETFLSLAQQECTVPYELIFIDNGSTDNSKLLIQKLSADHPNVSVTYLYESQKGKQHAFIRGVKEARSEALIICDDDNHFHTNYLQKAFEILTVHPKVGIIGGRSEGKFTIDKPHWLDGISFRYAIGSQKRGESGIYNSAIPWGAGMVLRKTWVSKIIKSGYPLMVMGSTSHEDLSAAEDTELVFLARLMGWQIYITDDLVLDHAIPKNRLTMEHAQKLSKERPKSFLKISQFYNQIIQWENLSFLAKTEHFLTALFFKDVYPGNPKQVLQLYLGTKWTICPQTKAVISKILAPS